MAGVEYTSLAIVAGDYRVTLVDAEPVLIRIIGADILRWEQVNGKSFFAGEVGLSRLAWIAWAAMTRKKLTELSVADFMASLEDLEKQDEEPEQSGEVEEDEGVPLPSPTEVAGTV